MIYDLIKTDSEESFKKAIQYFEFLGTKNNDVSLSDFDLYPIVVVESNGEINCWTKDACDYDRYNEVFIPARFLNRKVYTKEEAMEEFNCIIL